MMLELGVILWLGSQVNKSMKIDEQATKKM